MVSLENTKRLKELGVIRDRSVPSYHPTLPQLLEEVEKRGYHLWTLRKHDISGDYSFSVYLPPDYTQRSLREADTKEDAVALVLISILEEP